ncbi:HTH_Tnp_Tc3_2 domain-containing protein [Trichonephila clavipes]|nr:HTH_Tnp_Tc3_2 domain-containing protein [Trichonephila clavipes]
MNSGSYSASELRTQQMSDSSLLQATIIVCKISYHWIERGWGEQIRELLIIWIESDAAIRKGWEQWVNSGRFQRHDGSGRPKTTEDREDRLVVRSAVTELDSLLSTIRHATHTLVSTMTIYRYGC